MKIKKPISVLAFALLFLLPGISARGQLITDNQSRLKTTKAEKRGFVLFQRKATSTGKSAARSKKEKIKPRYSKGVVSFSFRSPQPRYSQGNPLSGVALRFKPRYTDGKVVFPSKYYAANPRYSSGSPFKSSKFKIDPRYSPGSPFQKSRYKINPRYSDGSPFGKRYIAVKPRYSPGSPFRNNRYHIKPRYSEHRGFQIYAPWALAFTFKKRWETRYKAENLPLANYRGTYKPRPNIAKQTSRQVSGYDGDFKLKPVRGKDLHPSASYRMMMGVSGQKLRNSLRKWNVLWVQLNRNKQQPNAVKEKISKPKFDKKEREIWNN
ncbi:MAG: hypothetical protein KI790_08690 [Cyclobacteriaceae bacterium]|nr:hypothetical protein [Cyclobacteriaceae bacterium HetDA_MAG_MS6]